MNESHNQLTDVHNYLPVLFQSMARLLHSLYNIDLGPNRLVSSDLCIFTFARIWSIYKEKKKLLLVRVIWCSEKAECLIHVVDHLKLYIKLYSYQNINTAS